MNIVDNQTHMEDHYYYTLKSNIRNFPLKYKVSLSLVSLDATITFVHFV